METATDTRSRLLRAAVNVIATKGERAVKVRNIAEEAGVTEPSIYHFFGSREGLISAAQAARFGIGQRELMHEFADRVFKCRTKRDFYKLIYAELDRSFDPGRIETRFTRVSVLGSAQTRPGLAAQLAAQQRAASKALAEPLRFAQSKGWMERSIDCEVLSVVIIGITTSRLFIEIDPDLSDSTVWDTISGNAILSAMGLPPRPAGSWEAAKRNRSAG